LNAHNLDLCNYGRTNAIRSYVRYPTQTISVTYNLSAMKNSEVLEVRDVVKSIRRLEARTELRPV